MSKLMKFGIIQVCTWGLVGIGMGFIFATSSVTSTWGDNAIRTVLLALLFFLGFGVDFALRMIEKSKKRGFRRDERDMAIQGRAMSIGFVCLVIYIFLVAVILYTYYEDMGTVPIGWVWFMAYSTIVVANLSAGISSLIIYSKQGY